jgi:hypothetical protein
MAIEERSVGDQAPTVEQVWVWTLSDRSERKRAEGRGLHQIGSRFQGMHIVAAARIAGIARENIGRVE